MREILCNMTCCASNKDGYCIGLLCNNGQTEIRELYEMQEDLDRYIILKNDPDISDKELLTDTILALQVEVSELANATRAFKHWSRKKAEPRGVLLEEYADILHFFLSLGLQLGFSPGEVVQAYRKKNRENYRRQQEGY